MDRPFKRAEMANDGSVSFAVSLFFVNQTQFGCICLKKKKERKKERRKKERNRKREKKKANPYLRLKKC